MVSLIRYNDFWQKDRPSFNSVLFSLNRPIDAKESTVDTYRLYDKAIPPVCRVFLAPNTYTYWGQQPPSDRSKLCWCIAPKDNNFQLNILNFLCGYANTLIEAAAISRPFPPIGYYMYDVNNPVGII
jgi:hypothetical protein